MNLSRQHAQKWLFDKIKKNIGIKFSNFKNRQRKQREPLRTRFLRECMK